jgi:hypothetical protein
MFNKIISVITNPYNPCVPGRATNINVLPNFSGSSVISPEAASPTIPIPFAEPIPAKPVANAAPKRANINPPFSVKKFINVIIKVLLYKSYLVIFKY